MGNAEYQQKSETLTGKINGKIDGLKMAVPALVGAYCVIEHAIKTTIAHLKERRVKK